MPDMPGLHLHLLVPGLLGPLPRQVREQQGFPWPAVPALELLLARSDAVAHPGDGAETLFRLFGLPAYPDGQFPTAALARIGDGLAPDTGCWMHADPVYLQADRDRVLLFDARHLDLGSEQARRLAAELETYYAEDRWRIEFAQPDRWYLRLPEPLKVLTQPLDAVVGRHIEPYLPAGEAGADWRYRLNETQMLLHAAAVNQERAAAGQRPINGVWYWGAGALPPASQGQRFEAVWADDPLTRGLARHAGLHPRDRPGGLEQLLAAAPVGEHLAVLDGLRCPLLDADPEAWRRGVLELETRWLQPLLAALRRRQVGQLSLYPLAGSRFGCSVSGLRRFWRRSRPLRTLVAETADA